MSACLCQVNGLGIQFCGEPLFSKLNHSLSAGLTGLVAPNGHGKSVLLRLLAGQLTPTEGRVHWQVPRAWLGQELQGPRLADALGVGDLWDSFQRIERGEADLREIEQVADLWHLPSEWAQLVASAGVPLSLNDPVATLSGGERTRLALCRLLMQRNACLLLDEPTNHLDRSGRQWLMSQLAAHPGGALIASHDRTLLRGMDRIVELTSSAMIEYGGGYDLYHSVKSAQTAALEREIDGLTAEQHKQKQAAQAALEKSSSRRKHGERERKSGSQGKMLMDARKDRAEGSLSRLKHQHRQRSEQIAQALQRSRAQLEQQRIQRLSMSGENKPGGIRLHLSDLVLPYGDKRPITRTVHSGERWHIRGKNGSGKSTLLKVIAGLLDAERGEYRVRGQVMYLDQHFSVLTPTASALANLKRLQPDRTESELRTQLANLRMRGEKALLPVQQLSGGERLKVSLLAVIAGTRTPDLLLLDEPDNHLDLDSKVLLEQTLAAYPGTLMVVSHDEAFISALSPDQVMDLLDAAGNRRRCDC